MQGQRWSTVVLLLIVPSNAAAYCLMTTCDTVPTPSSCSGSLDERGCSDEGKQLSWGTRCVSFSVHSGGAARLGISASELQAHVEAAYSKWQSVKCSDGKSPQFSVQAYPESNCDQIGFRPEGPNRNLWVFRENDWYLNESVSEAIALTSLTVDKSKGIILDADVELNAYGYDFTLGATSVETDLDGVVLHEAGHVLGLGHSDWATSTMASDDEQGTVDARSLEADDVRAVCALLPHSTSETRCGSEPVGGFSTECEAPEGCCSMAVGRKTTLGPFGILVAIIGLLLRRSTQRWLRPSPTSAPGPR